MENAKLLLDKVLSNQVTSFLFVFSCAVGAVISIASGFWLTYQVVIQLGAY